MPSERPYSPGSPLAATGYTLALARMLVGELNALTVFLFAVLFGMGVDFAVHLHSLRQHEPDGSWRSIVENHIRPLASTMATTSGALGILLLAEFKAFREFGMISAVGVLLCFICALLVVPALDTLLPKSRRSAMPPRAPDPSHSSGPSRDSASAPKIRRARWLVLIAIAGIAAYGAPQLEFEKDLRELTTPPATDGKIKYGSAVGRCTKSTVLVAENDAALATVVRRFEETRDAETKLIGGAPLAPGKTEADRRPFVKEVYSLSTLMPENPGPKSKLLTEIAQQANDALAELDPDEAEDDERRTHLEALERLAKSSPLLPSELPDWARAPFVERDGKEDRLAHVCIRVNSRHLDDLVAASDKIDELIGDEAVLRADSRLVFADLISSMRRDAKRLPLLALAIIFGFILLDLRELRASAACFGVLVLGLSLALALMGLWPLHLNFFNLVVMPAVIGLSIDASIHLWHARGRKTAGATGRASLIAAMTTIGGFAGLLAARHPGLRSIGEVGVACVALCVGVAFLALYRRQSAS
jgi:predicted RND superfamily exporter protein